MPQAVSKGLADIDYKRVKVEVYVQNDIFSMCANPKEYEELKEKQMELLEEEETTTQGSKELKKENVMDIGEVQECKVPKPTREDGYNSDDYEYMELIPESGELKLFEYSIKIQKERERRYNLLNPNTSFNQMTKFTE